MCRYLCLVSLCLEVEVENENAEGGEGGEGGGDGEGGEGVGGEGGEGGEEGVGGEGGEGEELPEVREEQEQMEEGAWPQQALGQPAISLEVSGAIVCPCVVPYQFTSFLNCIM